MNATQPRIAVLITAYNAEKVIHNAIESLGFNQEPHHIFIVDDGSKLILENHIKPQTNLTILRAERNLGITGAANLGLRKIFESGYEFVARMDADDTVHRDRLVLQRVFLDENPQVAMVGSWGRFLSEDRRVIFHFNPPEKNEQIRQSLFYNCCFINPAVMFRTRIIAQIGFYDELHSNAAEDYEFARRIGSQFELANISQYLVDCVMTTYGISISKRRQQLRSRLKIQWQYKDLGNIHFYLGVAKTLLLWFIPLGFITAIKRYIKSFQKRS